VSIQLMYQKQLQILRSFLSTPKQSENSCSRCPSTESLRSILHQTEREGGGDSRFGTHSDFLCWGGVGPSGSLLMILALKGFLVMSHIIDHFLNTEPKYF
jgi:hypothetical protein